MGQIPTFLVFPLDALEHLMYIISCLEHMFSIGSLKVRFLGQTLR